MNRMSLAVALSRGWLTANVERKRRASIDSPRFRQWGSRKKKETATRNIVLLIFYFTLAFGKDRGPEGSSALRTVAA